MLKRFLKAKKGKELIEIIVLTPITIFLIIFSALQLMSYVFSSQVQSTSNTYTRAFITQDNFYNGLIALAQEADKEGNCTVVSITITTKDTNISATLNFSDDKSETTYFKKLYSTNSGSYVFNVAPSTSFEQRYNAISRLWERGNYVEIVTARSISDAISAVNTISIYNASTKERTQLDYGVSGIVRATSKNIIIG